MSWEVLPKGGDDIPWSASVRTPEKQTGHQHTRRHTQHIHTHFAQAYTEEPRQSFSAVLTSCSCPDTSSIRKHRCFLSIKHLLRCGRAPESPAPDKTHIADLTVAMQPHSPEKKREKKDGRTDRRLFSMPQPRCQNSNWNQSYYILLDTILAIFRYASMYRSYFHTVCKVF